MRCSCLARMTALAPVAAVDVSHDREWSWDLPMTSNPKMLVLSAAMGALLANGCASGELAKRSNNQRENAPALGIPGFEDLASPELRTKKAIVARFGQPVAERAAGDSGTYSFLVYPVKGWDEKLLILFHRDDLLAHGREQFEQSLVETARGHERTSGGRVVLYQRWVAGKTLYYTATREQIANASIAADKNRNVPPLSRDQAEKSALAWLESRRPGIPAAAAVRNFHELKSEPKTDFYVVGLMVGGPPPEILEVVVLMNGTVVPGDLEINRQ